MVYKDEILTHNMKRRTFKENVDPSEMKWHKDEFNRIIIVESGKGWKLQMDEELPQELKIGQKYFIPKDTYHRGIKGTGDLKIIIIEDNDKYHIPKSVMKEMKKGLFYGRKSKYSNKLIENILLKNYATKDDIFKIKEFFDSKPKDVVLNESFKGSPERNFEYVEWLSYGGKKGYEWVIKKF